MSAPAPLAAGRDDRSAEAAVADALARIDRLDPLLHAFVRVDPERALADARRLDRRTALGVPKGPLFGVPVAIKDVLDVAGAPTGGGSLTRADAAVAARSAAAVERLEAAGAVVVGKTATVEYAFGGWGTNETLGTPLNPWDTATPRVPGGSSNGSGVAVAAGLVPLALGTDTGGSIRLPASFCGVVGLKTTAGLVDKRGAMTLSTPLDTVGPLVRRVADAALALTVLADPERLAGGGPAALAANDGLTTLAAGDGLAALAAGDELAALAAGTVPSPRGLRIGVVENLGVALHPDTTATFRAMLDVLERAGAALVPVDLGRSMADFAAPCGHLLAVEAYMNFGAFAEEEPNRLGPAVRRRMLDGKRLPAPDFLRTLADRDAARRRVAALFARVDAIVTPTTAHPAIPLAGHDADASPAVFTRFANFVDLAAISVPCGLSADGLPIGVQINVPGFHEIRALAIAAVLEDAAGPVICPLAA